MECSETTAIITATEDENGCFVSAPTLLRVLYMKLGSQLLQYGMKKHRAHRSQDTYWTVASSRRDSRATRTSRSSPSGSEPRSTESRSNLAHLPNGVPPGPELPATTVAEPLFTLVGAQRSPARCSLSRPIFGNPGGWKKWIQAFGQRLLCCRDRQFQMSLQFVVLPTADSV